ncbi:MAG: hypothetical protein C4522_12625 [Desulfobacteraceae bacterium]|nr:MAG: hypothetical protein C4522_12625 [Desulfobacteraceae bacterium]
MNALNKDMLDIYEIREKIRIACEYDDNNYLLITESDLLTLYTKALFLLEQIGEMKKYELLQKEQDLIKRKPKGKKNSRDTHDYEYYYSKLLVLDPYLEVIKKKIRSKNTNFQSETDKNTDIGKKLQEYGRLKNEKKVWDLSINAAMEIGIYIGSQSKEKECFVLTRKGLNDKLNSVSKELGNLPNTRIDTIWKNIPEKFRKTAGKPKKE